VFLLPTSAWGRSRPIQNGRPGPAGDRSQSRRKRTFFALCPGAADSRPLRAGAPRERSFAQVFRNSVSGIDRRDWTGFDKNICQPDAAPTRPAWNVNAEGATRSTSRASVRHELRAARSMTSTARRLNNSCNSRELVTCDKSQVWCTGAAEMDVGRSRPTTNVATRIVFSFPQTPSNLRIP
jgi:hypothetical protein